MVTLAIIFGAISAIATGRGHKSPMFGVAGIILYFLIGVPVHSVTRDLPINSASWWSRDLTDTVISAALAVAGVSVLIFILPAKSPRSGPGKTRVPYLILAIVCLLLAIGSWAVWFFLPVMVPPGYQVNYTGQGMFAFFGILLFGTSIWGFRLYRQQVAAAAPTVLAADPRPPVLFLRSFKIDQVRVKADFSLASTLPWHPEAFARKVGQTFEEWLAAQMHALGPLIALGDPTDYLPSLGAARVYQQDDSWQETVADYARRARLVILVEGASRGLKWELDHVRQQCPPEKVIILTPPQQFRRGEWTEFSKLLGEAGFAPLEDPGPGAIIGFDDSFRPVIYRRGATEAGEYVAAFEQRPAAARRQAK